VRPGLLVGRRRHDDSTPVVVVDATDSGRVA
jgi:hypothetical protein